MIPNAQIALERCRMTVEINNLSAKSTDLLLQSVAAAVPEEASRLFQEAVSCLDQADQLRNDFASRYPDSLNLNTLER